MIRFIDSFAHMVSADICKKWTSGYTSNLTGTILPTDGRCSDPCLKLTSTSILYKGLTLHALADPKNGAFGFAFKNVSMLGSNVIMGVNSSLHPLFTVGMTSDGALHAYDEDGNVQASSDPNVLNSGGWYYIEVKWTVDGASSFITVRVNEVAVIDNEAVDFTLTSFPSLDSEWTSVSLRCSSNGTNYFGHVYVTDDYDDAVTPSTNGFLGDVRVQYLRPTTTGSNSDWSVVGGGTHANAVDKAAASDGTTPSVQSADVLDVDTNIYTDPTYTSGTCFGVQINMLVEKDASGPRMIAPVVYHSGVNHSGVAQAPSQGQKEYLYQMYDRHPATAAAWTYNAVAADQFGVEVAN